MKTGDFQMPFFGENYFAAATSLTGLRRAGHSIWLRASTTALLSLVSSVSAGITSSRHDAHLDKLRPNASHSLRDPCRGASVHRRQPEFRGRDSEPAARRFSALLLGNALILKLGTVNETVAKKAAALASAILPGTSFILRLTKLERRSPIIAMADTRRPAVEGRPVQGAPPEGPAEPIFRRGQGAPSVLDLLHNLVLTKG